MDGSDQDSALGVSEADFVGAQSDNPMSAYPNPSRHGNAEQEVFAEGGADESPAHQQVCMDGELEEPDGQRSSVSLDEDGGTHFEASQSQETVIRRGCPAPVPPETNRCESPLGLDMHGDNDVVFDPVQRLNFDEDDDDEDVDNGNELGEYPPTATEAFDSVESDLHQRPVVNGSEQGESSRSSGFQSLQDQGQNVRIIEGHDSSFLDDAPQQVQQPASYGFNFLHTQMIQVPYLPAFNVSGLANNGGPSPGGFASNHNRLLAEEEQAHNLYDSLEREDGSSLYGEGAHGHVDGEDTDDLQQYFTTGGAGPLSLLTTSNVEHPHQFHNSHHQQQEDSETFWEHDDSSDHGSYLSNSHAHPVASDPASSPHHGRLQSPPRNFQVELFAAHTMLSSNNVFLPSGRQGDGFNSPLEGDSGSLGEDDAQNFEDDNTDPLNAELSEEGLLQDTQMYAQPVTSASNLATSVTSHSRDVAGSTLLQMYNLAQHPASGFGLSQTANSKPRQLLDNHSPQQTPPKNLAWSQIQQQQQPVVELSTEGAGSLEGPTHGDGRQAGAGSSVGSKDLPQATTLNASGGAIPKQNQAHVARAQQKRRPAVQGSASSGDLQRSAGAGPRGVSQPAGRKSGSSGAAHNNRAGQKQELGQRATSTPEVGRGVLPGATKAPTSLHQGRKVHGKVTTSSPLASRANSHTSLASSAGSTNSRVSGVGKESHLVRSQKGNQGGQLPPSTLQEGSHGISNVTNKNHAASTAAAAQTIAAVSSTAALPRHITSQSQNRANPANQCEKTRGNAFRKFQKEESTREEPPHYRMSTHAGHVQSSRSFSQLGKNQGLPQQNPGNLPGSLGVQGASVAAGSHPVGKQHYQYGQGNSQRGSHGLRQQSLQRSQANLSAHQALGSDGALLAGASPSGSEGSHRSAGHESVMSQMEALKKQGHRLSPAELTQSHQGSDVQGMEDVRHHLQNILSLGAGGSFTGADQLETASDVLLSEPVNRQLNFDTDSSSFVGPSGPGDMSEILENFPTFSSKMFSNIPPASSSWLDTSAHSNTSKSQQTRTQQLRDSLEKEMYRRKLLEAQQQLAVAVSTDKRKDIMIEQLDKQLARVVEGWKKREAEKDEFLKTLTQEKLQIEETLQNQQVMINNFEVELAQTVDELKKEKERSAQTIRHLKEDIYEAERAKESAVEQLESEQDKYQTVVEEWETLKESKAGLELAAQQAQEKLEQEQGQWSVKEQELNNKIAEVKDATQKVINIEKVKTEDMKKKKETAELECADLKAEMKKVVLDMEQLLREKESQKVEMSIMEAKFESAQRKLEADLHAQMEKEIAEQASEFHARLDSTVEEMSERHRRQVGELHQRHQHDLAQQAAAINDQRDQKEEEFKHQIAELEEKLQEMRTENSALKQSKLKLESQRMEILTKLQLMMQSQWNEAVSLLVNTPQKKSLNSSFLSSSQSGSQLTSALAMADGNASVTSLNMLASSLTGGGAVARSGGGDSHSTVSQQLGKKSATPPPPQQSVSSGDTDKARESSRMKGQMEEEAHAQLDRMGRVEDYLERLSQHMEIPMTRNDLHQNLSDGNNATIPAAAAAANTATTTTTGINNSSSSNFGAQQKQQQHELRQPVVSYPHPASGSDNCELGHPKHQSKGQGSTEGANQIHGFVTGQGEERTVTTRPLQEEGGGQRASGEPWLQAVSMRPPQQSSSWPHSDSRPEFEGLLSSTYHQDGKPQYHHLQHHHQAQNYNHHQHQQQDGWSGQHGNFSLTSSTHHHHHSYPNFISSTSSSSLSPLALKQQQRHQQQQHDPMTTPPRQQQQHHLYSKSPKERRTASNINIYTPGSPTYMSSPERYNNNASSQWSSHAGHAAAAAAGTTAGHLSAPTVVAEGSRSPMKKPGQRQFSYVRQNDQLNESLSPPVRQTAERDHTDSASEEGSSFHDPTRLQANYSQLSEKLEEHQSRQGELQHYVRMLLSKAPGSVCSEPERDAILEPSILESSRDLTVDLDLNDTATALEVTSQLSRLQELREKEQSLRGLREATGQSLPPHTSQQQKDDQARADLGSLLDSSGVISSQGLSEISQLLMMYREQWETNPEVASQGNVAGQLMEALREMTTSISPEQAKVKKDSKKSSEAKVSPKSQRTRKMKKMLNGSQSSAELTSSTNPDTSQLDRSTAGRSGSVTNAAATKRKVAGTSKGAAAASGPVASTSHHHHQNHHINHLGEGPSKDRKAGPVGSTQSKASGGGAKTGGGSNGPVWK
ncbi:centrobin [Elysia marginata]|uniref:Centrobin n=1 Tax=Elysia marginata TaxID=1093978 RepID=A0AAV4JYA7_9GAST|nr:centrobin [Elysia marginata]